eukprot:16379-Pelagococcus_subviridis.AAC.1
MTNTSSTAAEMFACAATFTVVTEVPNAPSSSNATHRIFVRPPARRFVTFLKLCEPHPTRGEDVVVVPVREAILERFIRVDPFAAIDGEFSFKFNPVDRGFDDDAFAHGPRRRVRHQDSLRLSFASVIHAGDARGQRERVLAAGVHRIFDDRHVPLVLPVRVHGNGERRRGRRARVHDAPPELHAA